MSVALPPRATWIAVLERALAEDLGEAGDVTTTAVVPDGAMATGAIVARDAGVMAGLPIALGVFPLLDGRVTATARVAEGDRFAAGAVLADLSGPAAPILSGERVALNLLARLCGIATRTRGLVDAVSHTACRVAATRKTTPGLRALEKYAVACGGGLPHRYGLDDAVLIKDNHLIVAGGVARAVAAARASVGHTVVVEVEVTDLPGLEEAIAAGADIVLLDNMDPDGVRRAVAVGAGRVTLEASGGITPDTVVAYAETGVDLVSLGWLTHSVPALDIALDFATI